MNLNVAQEPDWRWIDTRESKLAFLPGSGGILDDCEHECVSKSARFAILNGRGEMAERLKAAVC